MAKELNLDKDNLEEDLKRKLHEVISGTGDDSSVEDEPEQDDEIELDMEDDDDESNIAEEVDEEEAVLPAKLSKQESAIVSLKRELKKKADELAQLKSEKDQQSKVKAHESLVDKYVAEGHDENVAKYMATKELEMSDIQKKIAINDFKADNARLIAKYPEAKNHIEKIIKDMAVTGDTAEQRCKVMFELNIPERDLRARQAAKGILESKTVNDNPVSRATRNSEVVIEKSITMEEKRLANKFREKFGDIPEKDAVKYLRNNM